MLTLIGAVYTARTSKAAAVTSAEATRVVAAVQVAPAQRSEDLKVLQATVSRVDEENGALRGRVSRVESILRAFAWTTDRWAQQMYRAGIEPEPVHPLVDEYNRTGV
ncbi:hypothetical protein [Streptomyces sp. NPDC046161]|uniref:hypothetical protein n=1 Tax=Streptomyces sp. NPDC046161 TaxID=3155132 RepID=UPI0033C81D5C